MTTAGLLVSLPQMVDLAIGSPECGAVNFNLLSAALQVIIHQLNLHEYVVDFRGPDVENIKGLIATAKPGLSLKISEAINTNSTTFSDRRQSEEVSRTEPRRNSKVESNVGTIRNERMIIVEPSTDRRTTRIPHIVVGVSQELFIQVQADLDNLKTKMSEILEIPQDETIIEAVRSNGQSRVTPVIDMWQALCIAKRMESAEQGMEKLATLVESLIHDIGAARDGDGGVNIFAQINKKLDALDRRIEDVADICGGEGGGKGGRLDAGAEAEEGGRSSRGRQSGQDDENIGELTNEIESLKTRLKQVETDLASVLKGIKGKNLSELFKDVDEIKAKMGELPEGGEGGGGMDEATMLEWQERFADFSNKLCNLDDTLSMQINKLQVQLMGIEKELGVLVENANTKNDAGNDMATMGDLFNKIVKLQEDLESLNKVADRITEEEEERTLRIDQMVEQVELLKTTKADREDLEDALADKADTQQVNRKVSVMQFDAACEDLTRHIEETMKKLSEQEELWQSTLDDLHMSIGGKLDKQEFDPLREFVNRKIKSLQIRLKALLAMKQEQEAAGTKSKILKNVNCISCDKDVIMYKENKFSTFPTPQSMPGTRSIKPYITYELDAVRKQQKSLPQGRNMNNLETALHDEKARKEKISADKPAPPTGHLCNRYCGGSHTMTQPQQRVAHLGHFLNQWGPQAIPLDEGQIMGTDGQMYKARDASGDAPKATAEETRRLSAQMQTEEFRERVPRMSSTLEAIKRERLSRTSKSRSLSKQLHAGEGSELEPVKEESEKDDKKGASRSSVRRSSKRLSDASKQKLGSNDDIKTRKSSSKNVTSPRSSLKKSQVSLKRLSQAATKEPTPPREEEGASAGALEEKPPEGEEAAEPAAEGGEGAPEAVEYPAEPTE